MAETGSFVLYRGDDVDVLFECADAVAIDPGTQAVFVLRPTPATAGAPTLEVPMTLLTPGSPSTRAVFQLVIPQSTTLTLAPGHYAYAMKRINPGAERVLRDGVCQVRPDTRHAL